MDSVTVNFPVGMRILAVDGDQASLRLLVNLLHQCHYIVTTVTHSTMALDILRTNRNNFDLVISAVNKPDRDGFYLLKQLELEMMDIPVLMLSEHSDKDLVMSCVMHGACNYLTKPLRMEEMENIWQHVVRRKMIGCGDLAANKEAGEGSSYGGTGSGNKISGQKRKGLSENEKVIRDDEQSSRKKARLVWTTDLHSKFVAAVQHLGLDKASPKRILELMNVEGLSKHHIASHLQKFRHRLEKSLNPLVQPIQSFHYNATQLSNFSENLSPLSEVPDDQLAAQSLMFYSSGSATGGYADPIQKAKSL